MKYLAFILAAVLVTTACAPAQMQHMQATATVATSTAVQFKYASNHIFVPATVDGKKFAFVFDTAGAASLVPAAAKTLNLPTVAQAQITGGGNVAETLNVVRPQRAAIGDAAVDGGFFLVLPSDLEMVSPYPDIPLGGVLGREFFAKLVLTIDYAKQTLTLTNPDAFHADPNAAAMPMTMRMGVFPNVEGKVDGAAGTFDIDAGSSAGLAITESFATANGILAKMPRTVDVTIGRGVGGTISGKAGRVENFAIGPFAFDRPTATVIHATGGAFATPGLAGNVGAEVLRRFTVTIDAPGQTLYLTKNDRFGEPFTFTRTGLVFDRKSGSLVVLDVVPGSPAERAGVHKGDVLAAVDGKPASSLTTDQIKAYARQPVGTVVHFSMERGGKHLRFAMTLAEII
jgi:hypothetical protein